MGNPNQNKPNRGGVAQTTRRLSREALGVFGHLSASAGTDSRAVSSSHAIAPEFMRKSDRGTPASTKAVVWHLYNALRFLTLPFAKSATANVFRLPPTDLPKHILPPSFSNRSCRRFQTDLLTSKHGCIPRQ